ncbi:nucleotidyltransferase domain-containing protein [Dyadobacter sp. CY345]|uniref:nucleotidyltransferase family protein n=1 Tax=Dyadobacter sp. CY345 TaxID=2909335 RepID=UPI001F2B75CD|nr:nucleotidyltransferase domain-containing protein [Dyadobacter sp. CY345]MCF2445165.1 nucleotidyltransferase domain-containing protein [Dyadobacter sp. CY345]
MFGLSESDILAINQVLASYPGIGEAYIFGSRAKGNYKNGSDVDIAIKGENVSFNLIMDISDYLNEETMMPYYFDVLNYHSINNKELSEHIDRAGVLIYKNKYLEKTKLQ